MKIVFSSNISWSIYNFRTKLLLSLKEQGHDIYVVAKEDTYSNKLTELGFTFIAVNINNNSKNPINDLVLIRNYIKIYKQIKPDIILHNAIKPNIYGTIAAGYLNIPTINNISGLGTLFIKKSIATLIAKILYKFSQKKATSVFFQNNYDRELFIKNKLVHKNKSKLIPGSGVDTLKFTPSLNTNSQNTKFEFLFIGRLLNDKGIREYINAAKHLKSKYANITFSVLGPFYEANSTAISKNEFNKWIANDVINYLGESDTVEKEIAHADSIVLPSYREGLSKVLIEASSMAKPIITTNVPGCKDVVIDDYNGYLCNVRDANDLALKMEKLYLLNKLNLKKLGDNARRRAIEIFDINIIIDIYTNEINKIIKINE